jgi:hypothetical protein
VTLATDAAREWRHGVYRPACPGGPKPVGASLLPATEKDNRLLLQPWLDVSRARWRHGGTPQPDQGEAAEHVIRARRFSLARARRRALARAGPHAENGHNFRCRNRLEQNPGARSPVLERAPPVSRHVRARARWRALARTSTALNEPALGSICHRRDRAQIHPRKHFLVGSRALRFSSHKITPVPRCQVTCSPLAHFILPSFPVRSYTPPPGHRLRLGGFPKSIPTHVWAVASIWHSGF